MFRDIYISLIFVCSASLSFGQGALAPPGPPAPMMKTLDQIEARIPIDAQTEITEPGSYYLTAPITAKAAAITIKASHVDLDLNTFGVSSASVAIDVESGFKGIRIRNGQIQNSTIGVLSESPVDLRDIYFTGHQMHALKSSAFVQITKCDFRRNSGTVLLLGSSSQISDSQFLNNEAEQLINAYASGIHSFLINNVRFESNACKQAMLSIKPAFEMMASECLHNRAPDLLDLSSAASIYEVHFYSNFSNLIFLRGETPATAIIRQSTLIAPPHEGQFVALKLEKPVIVTACHIQAFSNAIQAAIVDRLDLNQTYIEGSVTTGEKLTMIDCRMPGSGSIVLGKEGRLIRCDAVGKNIRAGQNATILSCQIKSLEVGDSSFVKDNVVETDILVTGTGNRILNNHARSMDVFKAGNVLKMNTAGHYKVPSALRAIQKIESGAESDAGDNIQ